MRKIATITLGLFLAGISLQAQTESQKKVQPVGEDVKDAGKATGRAAKKTGKKIARGTKKGVNNAAEKTAEGADKVKDATR